MSPAILSALIAIPFSGGIAAWLVGRRRPEAARWIALAAMLAVAVMSVALWVSVGSGGGAGPRVGTASAVDPALRHRISPGARWPQRPVRGAHRNPRHRRRLDLVARDRACPRGPLLLRAGHGRRDHGRVPGFRPVPLLFLLGADAGADVLSHRHLGSRRTHPSGRKVRHLHDDQRVVPADRHPQPLLRPRRCVGRDDDGLSPPSRYAPAAGNRTLAVSRLLRCLCGQVAAVPGAQLASRCPHRGAPRPAASCSPGCC